MKSKILIVAVALALFSCATKTPSPAPATPVVTEAKPAAVNVVALTPELAEGKNLYENNCVRCHKLYAPKKFSQEEWKPILIKMQKKAKLDDVKMASISNYIHSQL
jgi:cytochrome c5